MAHRKGDTYEANSFPESKEIKYFDHNYEGDDIRKMKRPFESSSIGNKHGSTSLKSDISTEISLPLSNASFEMNPKITRGKNVNTFENGTTHDSQHRTESSCSNSLSVIPPVSLSNHSFQETSKEGYSFMNYTRSIDSSNSKGFDRRSEEPVTASSESGVSAQIARKAIRNARAKNCLNISSIDGRHKASFIKRGDKEISGNSEISGESENILPMKGKLREMDREMMGKNKGEFLGNESFESSMIKPSKVTMKDEDTFVAGFDLNEDISNDFVEPVFAAIPSHCVTRVVAKAGVLSGPPMIPLIFEGERGWKGSAETSAFQPTSFYKSLLKKTCSRNRSPKYTRGMTGIDLNVAAVEDEMISSPSIFQPSQIDSKRNKSLKIDLNCLYDADDEFPPESKSTPLVDLNLNVNTSIRDASNNFHWLGNDSSIPKQDFYLAKRDYLTDFNTMQHLANNVHAQQYLVASPNMFQSGEPKMQFLPPPSYPYKGPFPFGTRAPLPSGVHFSSTIPYARYSHENGIFMNSEMGPTSLGTPHFVQVVHGQSSGNVKASVPKLDVKTEENFERMQREAWHATSMKRKEPEGGGLQHCQLGYRQVTERQ